jgi:adenine-specific DNA-methyltransferase
VASILGPPKVGVRRLWQARGIQPTTKGDPLETVPGPESTSTTPPSEPKLKDFEERFPGIIQDGVLDGARLGAILGIDVSAPKDAKERFGLMWAGKQDAIQALMTPSFATLKPDIENSINWDTAENVFIEGDNLEVLKLLQNAYNDQVKLIYIDPPYNTGNDFVYKDDFSDPIKHYLEVTGQVDAEGNKLVANTETSGRKHSNWLTMMYPRLVLARNLLTQDGAIFVSIDDNEVHNLRLMMDEIFGPENFVACVIWQKTYSTKNDAQEFSKSHEYLLVYKRAIWNRKLLPREEKNNLAYKYTDETGRGLFRSADLTGKGETPSCIYPIVNPTTGEIFNPPAGKRWLFSKDRMPDLLKEDRIFFGTKGTAGPSLKRYLSEVQDGIIPNTIWFYEDVGHTDGAAKEVKDLMGAGVFDYPKPLDLLSRVIQLGMSENDLILDFFAGSGTTGHATLLANSKDQGRRKFLLVNIGELTEESSIAHQQGYEKVSDITLGRLRAAMEKIPKSKEHGLKVLSLAKSNFHIAAQSNSDELQLFESTLEAGAIEKDLTQELLLKLGERLDTVTERVALGNHNVVRCGSTLLVPSLKIDETLVKNAIDLATGVVVFLEDAFSGKDALKANAFFTAKSSNKILKTY